MTSPRPEKRTGCDVAAGVPAQGPDNPTKGRTGASWEWVFGKLEAEIRVRHYSGKTLQVYRSWTRKLQSFTRSKQPTDVTVEDVKAFLSFLAVEKQVAASSQNQAFNALLFVFRHVFGREFGKIDGVVRAKRRPYIPVVLSRKEVDRVTSRLAYPYDLVAKLLYGCGLRLFECMKLRVQDLDLDVMILTVHDGKGKKDRTVPVPRVLRYELELQLEQVRSVHRADLENGFAGVFLPDALSEKYRSAATELAWQWLFPAKALTHVAAEDASRRWHLHETHV